MHSELYFCSVYKYAIFLLILVASCKTIEPIAPETKTQVAPVAERPVSVIVVPLSIQLAPYFTLADKQVPNTFDGGDSPCSGVSYQYHFERDPLQLNGLGNEMSIDVSGKYRLKMSYCPECTDWFSDKPSCITPRIPFSCGYGEPMRRMQIRYLSHFELTPDYRISTKTRLDNVQAIDPCEVTVFAYDATDELVKEVRKSLEKLAIDIDKQTAAISFRQQAADLWKEMETPFPVPGFGFLHLQPKNVLLTQPSVKGSMLTASLVMQAYPFFSTDKRTLVHQPLPDLQLSNSYPNDTLQLVSDLELGYDSLSTIINRYVSGTKLLIKEKEVIIDSIHITGADARNLVFRLQFSGKKRGTLFITGEPVFDPETQQIELRNVDFDLETKSTLLKTAKWLFSDRILQEITKASKQDLKPQLSELQKALNKSLRMEQNGFLIIGTLLELKVNGIYPETDRLTVRVSAKGKLSLASMN